MICKNKNIVILPSTCSAPTLALHPLEISAKYRHEHRESYSQFTSNCPSSGTVGLYQFSVLRFRVQDFKSYGSSTFGEQRGVEIEA
jgi:hypothetical protein